MRIIVIVLSFVLFIVSSGEEAFSQGLYLKRGVGIPGFLEIGKKAEISRQVDLYYRYLEEYGLAFEQHNESEKVLTLNCNKAGCATDNNVGVGAKEKDVIRRFGLPIEEKKFDGSDKRFISYDGVAFKIERGRVITIYILPVLKKNR